MASANLVEASRHLKDLVDHYEDIHAKVQDITDCEHRGDNITHQIFGALHSTFITPLEREDIVALTHSLDDVMDFIESAADTMLLYKVERPTETARRLAEIIARACQEVSDVMPLLRRKDTMKRVLPATVTINSLENEADDVMRHGLALLLEKPDEVMDFLRWREIYEMMESATDRGEDVANALEAIVLKNS
jgi:hypothetical protein